MYFQAQICLKGDESICPPLTPYSLLLGRKARLSITFTNRKMPFSPSKETVTHARDGLPGGWGVSQAVILPLSYTLERGLGGEGRFRVFVFVTPSGGVEGVAVSALPTFRVVESLFAIAHDSRR